MFYWIQATDGLYDLHIDPNAYKEFNTRPSKSMKPTYYINASLLSKGTCRRRFILQAVEGYGEPGGFGNLNDTCFGSCWHKYREILVKTKGNHFQALMEANQLWDKINPRVRGAKDFITKDYLNSALMKFNQRYTKWDNIEGVAPVFIGDVPLIESSFNIPVYIGDDFNLNLCGTIDRIGLFNGNLIIEDDKTTTLGQKNPLEYLESFRNTTQFRLYYYIFYKMRELFPDTPLGKTFNAYTYLAVRIFGVFYSAKQLEFITGPIFAYSSREIHEFSIALEERINELVRLIKDHQQGSYVPKDGFVTGDCKDFVFYCPYMNVCNATEDLESVILERSFVKKPYNPLERD